MAQILQFPSSHVQGLSFLENQLRELLQARGADRELIDFAAVTVKDIYQRNVEAENYNFKISLPDSISEQDCQVMQTEIQAGLESIRAENHAIVIRLIAELALAQVKIFQQQRTEQPA